MSYGCTIVSQRWSHLNAAPQIYVIILAQTLFNPVWVWAKARLPGYQHVSTGFVLVHWLWETNIMHNALIATYPCQHCLMHKIGTLRACLVLPIWLTHVCVRMRSVLSTSPKETRTVRNNQIGNQTRAWGMKDLREAERIYQHPGNTPAWIQSNRSNKPGCPKGAISVGQPLVLSHIADQKSHGSSSFEPQPQNRLVLRVRHVQELIILMGFRSSPYFTIFHHKLSWWIEDSSLVSTAVLEHVLKGHVMYK